MQDESFSPVTLRGGLAALVWLRSPRNLRLAIASSNKAPLVGLARAAGPGPRTRSAGPGPHRDTESHTGERKPTQNLGKILVA